MDGGGRGVIFSGISCGRHKCMLPKQDRCVMAGDYSLNSDES